MSFISELYKNLRFSRYQRFINGAITVFLIFLYLYYSKKILYSSSTRDFIKLDLLQVVLVLYFVQTIINHRFLNVVIMAIYIGLGIYYTYSVMSRIFNVYNMHCYDYDLTRKTILLISLIILYIILAAIVFITFKMKPINKFQRL
jgi:hypothetical protein